MDPSRAGWTRPALAAALLLLVLAVYAGAGGWAFINMDDGQFVYNNDLVRGGLSAGGAAQAFTTFHWYAWTPVTWLSHMLDVSLFGLDAGWHHRVNVLFHGGSTLLLFLFLSGATGRPWESALAAALFGVHPLHVESVAWVAERKDVLSTFFAFLSLNAYLRYARRPGTWRYLAVALAFALSLLSKPMVVTLPFVLLLLDAWPLGRFGEEGATARSAWPLVREKIPLFLLSAASSVLTVLAARGAVVSAERYPPWERLANALVSYAAYLGQAAWPARLSVFYPHPGFLGRTIPPWQPAAALLLLAAVTAAAWYLRRHRYLAVGWLWYLGTLVPAIGLVQTVDHARADRYTYVPLVGIFVALAWGLSELAGDRKGARRALAAAGLAAVLLLAAAARVQAGYWRDSVTLFTHAIAASEENHLAWTMLGTAYTAEGRYAEAVDAHRRALRIRPEEGRAWSGLGVAYGKLGRPEEAAESFREAVRLRPAHGDSWNWLGKSLAETGRDEEAVAAFEQGVRLLPGDPFGWNGMGVVYRKLGREREAAAAFREALRIRPDHPVALYNLGEAAAALGETAEAREAHRRLRAVDPALADRLLLRLGGG